MKNYFYGTILSLLVGAVSPIVNAQTTKMNTPKLAEQVAEFRNSIFAQQDMSKVEGMIDTFKKKFPNQSLDGIYFAVSYVLAKSGQGEKAIKYAQLIKDRKQNLTTSFYSGEILAESNPKLAQSFVKKALEKHSYVESDTTVDESSRYAYWRLQYTYGKLAKKEGNNKEALDYITRAYKAQKRDQEIVIAYAEIQQENGNYKETFPILDDIVKSGEGSPSLKKKLLESYTKLNPTMDAQAYMDAIEKKIKAKVMEEYVKKAVNEPAPAFVLTTADGKTVTLADFKGKTIVLDFWATWCGPCKASFPAMQLAVNRYKNDPSVKFLFIHTWETTNTPMEEAKKYLSDNKYTFDLYIDPKKANDGKNQSAEMFGFKGIPQKYVIDKNGTIRFSSIGFSGGEDAAVEELSAMIEDAKKI